MNRISSSIAALVPSTSKSMQRTFTLSPMLCCIAKDVVMYQKQLKVQAQILPMVVLELVVAQLAEVVNLFLVVTFMDQYMNQQPKVHVEVGVPLLLGVAVAVAFELSLVMHLSLMEFLTLTLMMCPLIQVSQLAELIEGTDAIKERT